MPRKRDPRQDDLFADGPMPAPKPEPSEVKVPAEKKVVELAPWLSKKRQTKDQDLIASILASIDHLK